MKLISYQFEGGHGIGLLRGDEVIDVRKRIPVDTLRQLLARELLPEVARLGNEPADHLLSELTLLPVIPDPEHIFCVGTNYSDHLKEVQEAGIERPTPKQPALFVRFPETLVGAGAPMLMPVVSEHFDYEAELAVVIGEGGRYIAKEDALRHVAGYTCFNDGSVRDWQFHTSQVTSGKNFVQTGALGPWLVTADEVGDPGALGIECRLQGRVMQRSNTRHMIFDVPTIIAYVSSLVPLKAGDVIATGTPEGVGFSRKPPVFMKPGDVCEIEIERIGVLRNPIRQAHRAET